MSKKAGTDYKPEEDIIKNGFYLILDEDIIDYFKSIMPDFKPEKVVGGKLPGARIVRRKGFDIYEDCDEKFALWGKEVYFYIFFLFGKVFFDELNPKTYKSLDELDKVINNVFEENKNILKEIVDRAFFTTFFCEDHFSVLISRYLSEEAYKKFDEDEETRSLYNEKGEISLFLNHLKDFEKENYEKVVKKYVEYIEFITGTEIVRFFSEAIEHPINPYDVKNINIKPLLERLIQVDYFWRKLLIKIYDIIEEDYKNYKEEKSKGVFSKIFNRKSEKTLLVEYFWNKVTQIQKKNNFNLPWEVSRLKKTDADYLKEKVFERKVSTHIFCEYMNNPELRTTKLPEQLEKLNYLFNILNKYEKITPEDLINNKIEIFSDLKFIENLIGGFQTEGGTFALSIIYMYPFYYVVGMKKKRIILDEISLAKKGVYNKKSDSLYEACLYVSFAPLPALLIDKKDENMRKTIENCGWLFGADNFRNAVKKALDYWVKYLEINKKMYETRSKSS